MENLEEERKALRVRYPGLDLRFAGEHPVFEGEVAVDCSDVLVRLTFPPGYPYVPPAVSEVAYPKGPALRPVDGLYRFPDGTLCLFPHGNDPQAWDPSKLAVEAIDRFVELKRAEGQADPTRRLFRPPWRLVIPPRIVSLMGAPQSYGKMRLRRSQHGGDIFVEELCVEKPSLKHRQVKSPWLDGLKCTYWIHWFNMPFSELAEIKDAHELSEKFEQALPTQLYSEVSREDGIVIHDGFKVVACFKDPSHVGALLLPEIVLTEPEELVFARSKAAIPRHAVLGERTVVMIGLGSLGSSVTVALARAGVRRFVLIDPKRLTFENVSRHVGRLADVGRHKVEIVRDEVIAINPTAEVKCICKHFAWDLPAFSAGLEVESLFRESEKRLLVVSTCAVERAEEQLNALAVRHRIPVIFGAALGAAAHARVFRVLPGTTPCYSCIVRAQQREPEKHPRFVEAGVDAEHRPYLDPSLPGLAIDINAIAMLIGRMAIQTLTELGGTESSIGRSEDHVLWTNRGGWIFDCPLQAVVERIERDNDCPVCGSLE